MKIITEPTVYLIGRQVVDGNALDRFLVDHDAGGWASDSEVGAEVLSEVGGRLCYMSFAKPRPGGNSAYLAHIKEVGHGSVLEHAVFNLVIVGVSRSLTHELVRHRAGFGYSQLSQRYVDESVAEYVEPDIIAADPELHALWLDTVDRTHRAYRELAEKLNNKLASRGEACDVCGNKGYICEPGVKGLTTCPECKGESRRSVLAAMFLPPDADATTRRKTARQAARSVLPNATETKISVTANARSLRHFLEQRGSRHAEPEIRKLANVLLDILAAESPNLFGDYTRTPLPDGTAEITTPYPKV